VAQRDEYVMGGLEAEAESRRLGLLESTRDPGTIRTGVSRPGDPGYEFAVKSVLDSAPRLIAAGILDESGVSTIEGYFGRPGTYITGPSVVAAWGHKPAARDRP
jgi:hypothetical protein